MLWIFKKTEEKNSHNKECQFCGRTLILYGWILLPSVLEKLNYLHNNPVKAGGVEKAEDYLLSSSRDYQFGGGGSLAVKHLTAAYTLRAT
jgi:putative transposase